MIPPPCVDDTHQLNPCARNVYDQHVQGLYRLAGPWSGWRIQGHALIGPGGVRWTPATLHAAMTWQAYGLAGLAELRDALSASCGTYPLPSPTNR